MFYVLLLYGMQNIGETIMIVNVQQQINEKINVDFIYYALDWLFILSLIKIKEGKVYYENKKVNSTQNTAF